MKLEIEFNDLISLVKKMGAGYTEWASNPLNLRDVLLPPPIEWGGVDVSIDEIVVSPDGHLTYQGKKIVLYIKDTRRDAETLLHDPEKSPKFHVSECQTLEKMRHKNRFQRYVATRRTDGRFYVDSLEEDGSQEELEARLFVCKNCLERINFKGYDSKMRKLERTRIRDMFDLAQYIVVHTPAFKEEPRFTDKTAPRSDYSDNWDQISKVFRESREWICDYCGVNLSENKNLLDTHHLNGVKGDNREDNFEALCKLCHQKQPDHGNMHINAADARLIHRKREQQRIKS